MADTTAPNTSSTVGEKTQSALSTAQDYAASAGATIQNTAANATESLKNSDIANGPVAQNIKKETTATSNEFSNLAAAKQVPDYTAANDTTLTHYHSWFFELFSWRQPRATALTFATSIILILVSRYVPLTRLFLKALWTSLGVVTLAEVATKTVMGTSVAGSVRPRRYYKIPKETLEATLDDVEQLINFFVIEVQRIIFAENVPVTAAAFLTTLASYYLVKIMPAWGFLLLGDIVLFVAPLVYVQNKELIDSQLEHASNVIGEQTAQIKDITAQQTSKGLESVKAYTGEYASVASEYIGKSRQKIQMPGTNGTTNTVQKEDFPRAPNTKMPNVDGPAVNMSNEAVHAT